MFTRSTVCSSFIGCVLLVAAVPVSAQQTRWEPGERMNKSMTKLLTAVQRYRSLGDFGFDNQATCLAATHLAEWGSWSYERPFCLGKRYLILAVGEDLGVDLDLEVRTPEGRLVKADARADGIPSVLFIPSERGTYTITMSVAKARRPNVCAVVVLRQGGGSVPYHQQKAALARVLRLAEAADRDAEKSLRFSPNGPCVVGSFLAPGQSRIHEGIRLDWGRAEFIAAGSGHGEDIDLQLLDADGDVVAEDDRRWPAARVAVEDRHGEHAVRVLNSPRSRGSRLVLTAVLKHD